MQFFQNVFFRVIFFLCYFFLWNSNLIAQNIVSSKNSDDREVITQIFDQQSGLPVVSLTDMVLGADNHIYIASSGGVSRFNGTDFESISTEQFPQLNSNRIRFLQTSTDSSLWMIDEQGFFSRWKQGKLQTFDSLFTSEVHSEWTLRASRSGAIWIHDTQSFMVYDAPTKSFIEKFTIPDKKYYNFLPISDSLIFILTDEGLFEFSDQKLSLKIPVDQLPFDPEVQMYFYWNTNISQISNYEIAVADSGSLALYNLQTKEYLRFPFIDDMQSTPSVLKVTDDELLVTTLNGHFNLDINTGNFNVFPGSKNQQMGGITYSPIWQGKRLYISETSVHYDGEMIFKLEGDQRIAQAVQDKEGNIWLAVAGLGLVKIGLSPFKVLNSSTGLQSDNTYSIIEDQNRNIWIASFEFGVHRVTGENINWWSNSNNSLVNNLTRALYERKDGSIIAGFWDSGLYEFNGSTWRKFLLNDTLLLPQAESFYEDADGNFWIGARMGLYKSTSNTNTFYEQYTSSGDPVFRTQVIRADPTNKLWLGTHGSGLLILREGNIERVHFKGLEPQPKIRDLYFTTRDTLWIATETNGLIRATLDSTNNIKSFDLLTQKDGLPDFGVHRILPDAYGYFWLPTNQGVARIEAKKLNTYLDNPTTSLWIKIFTESDGLPIREANGGTQSNGLVASDSTIYIPTLKGVIHFDPLDFLDWNPYKHTQIQLASIETNSNTYTLYGQNELTIAKNERSLNIDFNVLHYTNPQHLNIEYRIPVLGKDWNKLSQDRQLTITNLPPGTHSLETRLAEVPYYMHHGNTFTLTIPPYFYEQIWFRILSTAGFLIIIGFLFHLNNKAAQRRERVLNERVFERTGLLNEQKAETEKALRTIQQQALELEKLNKVKTDFFINMTHELRTPLALIKGPLNLLKDTSRRENIDQKEQLAIIERNSTQLNKVIDQLLNLLRMESDFVQSKPKKINLTEFVRVHAAQFQSAEDLKQKTFVLPDNSDEVLTVADPETLTLIINNLISNAIKYTRKQDSIYLRVSKNEKYAIFEIQDTGIGIPKDEIDHILEPFFRSNNITYQKGSGIGLSIVKNFIDRMNGKIDIQSELKKGTTIKIFFPIPNSKQLNKLEFYKYDNIEPSETYHESLLKAENSQKQFTKKERTQKPDLLIVEDNEDLQLFLTRLLEQDYNVHVSENGESALEYLENSIPDLIISDVMMPKMDGITFVQTIRKMENLRFIPVIILSAKKSDKSIREGLSAGAQVYLIKPLNNQILLAQIESLLEQEERISSINVQPSTQKLNPQQKLKTSIDELILRHISDPDLSVEKIAATLHMSRPTLYRKWNKFSKPGLSEYIIQTRLQEAIRLISEKGYSFAEASFVCGFSDPSYFSRVFKKYFNQTPTEYFENKES